LRLVEFNDCDDPKLDEASLQDILFLMPSLEVLDAGEISDLDILQED
jgi:hypothetical protein